MASAHSSQIVMPRSWSHLTLVSPRMNHSSSPKIDRVCTFLVVTSGNPSARSKRIWWPKTLRVPVPVRSDFSTPSSRIRRRRSRYACMGTNVPVQGWCVMVIGLGAALLAAVLFGVGAVVQAVAARRYGLVSWMMALVAVIYVLGWAAAPGRRSPSSPCTSPRSASPPRWRSPPLLAATVVGEPLALRHWVAIGVMVAGLVAARARRRSGRQPPVRDRATPSCSTSALVVILVARPGGTRARTGRRSGVAPRRPRRHRVRAAPRSPPARWSTRTWTLETIAARAHHRPLRPARVLAVLHRPATRGGHGGERAAGAPRDGGPGRRRDASSATRSARAGGRSPSSASC